MEITIDINKLAADADAAFEAALVAQFGSDSRWVGANTFNERTREAWRIKVSADNAVKRALQVAA